jgi:hypothetical protein
VESHSLTPHPANTIAAELMYPLSPHLWNMPAPVRLFLYGLPEARLYTQTGHTVTVRLPSTTFATQTRLSRVHDTIFWRLIAQHPLTHKLIPLQRPEYDQRARNIHAQLRSVCATPTLPNGETPERRFASYLRQPHTQRTCRCRCAMLPDLRRRHFVGSISANSLVVTSSGSLF